MASSSSEFNQEDENLVFYLMHKMSGGGDRTSYREGFQHIRDIVIYKYQPENLPPSLTYYSGKAKVYFALADTRKPIKIESGGSWCTRYFSETENGKLIARKTTLVYHEENETSEAVKTPWIMEEYMLFHAQKNKELKMATPWSLCVVSSSRK